MSGRPFTIKKQFIDDLKINDLISIIPTIRKPLLVLYSPQDHTVDAQELGPNSTLEFIEKEIELKGDLSKEQRQQILEIEA